MRTGEAIVVPPQNATHVRVTSRCRRPHTERHFGRPLPGSPEPNGANDSEAGRLALGEEDTAFGFIGTRIFVNDDRHGVGRGLTVADDRVGNVLDQRALLFEAATLHHLDDYFRHTRSVR